MASPRTATMTGDYYTVYCQCSWCDCRMDVKTFPADATPQVVIDICRAAHEERVDLEFPEGVMMFLNDTPVDLTKSYMQCSEVLQFLSECGEKPLRLSFRPAVAGRIWLKRTPVLGQWFPFMFSTDLVEVTIVDPRAKHGQERRKMLMTFVEELKARAGTCNAVESLDAICQLHATEPLSRMGGGVVVELKSPMDDIRDHVLDALGSMSCTRGVKFEVKIPEEERMSERICKAQRKLARLSGLKEQEYTSEMPDWPRKRPLDRVVHLIGVSGQEDLLDLMKTEEALAVDVGAGSEACMLHGLQQVLEQELKEGETRPKLVAVYGHNGSLHAGIRNIFTWLPSRESIAALREFEGKANIVTDIFGAFSFSTKPVKVLFLEIALLRPGGRLYIVTELDKFLSHQKSWDKIQQFLEEYDVEFVRTHIDTTAESGLKKRERQLCVRVQRQKESRKRQLKLDDLAGVYKRFERFVERIRSCGPIWRLGSTSSWCILQYSFGSRLGSEKNPAVRVVSGPKKDIKAKELNKWKCGDDGVLLLTGWTKIARLIQQGRLPRIILERTKVLNLSQSLGRREDAQQILKALKSCEVLTALIMKENYEICWEDVYLAFAIKTLRTLDVSRCKLGGAENLRETLRSLGDLEEFTASANELGVKGLQYLLECASRSPNLKSVDLSRNHVRWERESTRPAHAGGLRSLTLSNCFGKRSQEWHHVLLVIDTLFPSLEELDLTGNRLHSLTSPVFGDEHTQEVPSVLKFKSLKKVSLGRNARIEHPKAPWDEGRKNISEHSRDLFRFFAGLRSVETIELKGSNLHDDAIEMLWQGYNLPCCTSLDQWHVASVTTLDLSNNYLSALPRHVTTLTKLDVSCNKIEVLDDATLRNLPHLRSLNVSSNPIRLLPAALGELAELTELDISHTKLCPAVESKWEQYRAEGQEVGAERSLQKLLVEKIGLHKEHVLVTRVPVLLLEEQPRTDLISHFPGTCTGQEGEVGVMECAGYGQPHYKIYDCPKSTVVLPEHEWLMKSMGDNAICVIVFQVNSRDLRQLCKELTHWHSACSRPHWKRRAIAFVGTHCDEVSKDVTFKQITGELRSVGLEEGLYKLILLPRASSDRNQGNIAELEEWMGKGHDFIMTGAASAVEGMTYANSNSSSKTSAGRRLPRSLAELASAISALGDSSPRVSLEFSEFLKCATVKRHINGAKEDHVRDALRGFGVLESLPAAEACTRSDSDKEYVVLSPVRLVNMLLRIRKAVVEMEETVVDSHRVLLERAGVLEADRPLLTHLLEKWDISLKLDDGKWVVLGNLCPSLTAVPKEWVSAHKLCVNIEMTYVPQSVFLRLIRSCRTNQRLCIKRIKPWLVLFAPKHAVIHASDGDPDASVLAFADISLTRVRVCWREGRPALCNAIQVISMFEEALHGLGLNPTLVSMQGCPHPLNLKPPFSRFETDKELSATDPYTVLSVQRLGSLVRSPTRRISNEDYSSTHPLSPDVNKRRVARPNDSECLDSYCTRLGDISVLFYDRHCHEAHCTRPEDLGVACLQVVDIRPLFPENKKLAEVSVAKRNGIDGESVVVKCMSKRIHESALWKELRLLVKAKEIPQVAQGVVPVLGYCKLQDGREGIVLECGTPLSHNLSNMTVEERLRVALDVANTVRELLTLGILHCDIALRNVILRKEGERERALLIDFGNALELPKGLQYDEAQAPWGGHPPPEAAPEIKSSGASESTEAWSFGVFVWCLFHDEHEWTVSQPFSKICQTDHNVQRPPQCPKKVWDVVSRCWKGPEERHLRPSFLEIVETLRAHCGE